MKSLFSLDDNNKVFFNNAYFLKAAVMMPYAGFGQVRPLWGAKLPNQIVSRMYIFYQSINMLVKK